MREMTFGDLAVPREIKRTAAALFDRHGAYRGPLAARQPAPLLRALEAQMAYLVPAGGLDAARIAHYMLEAADGLAASPAARCWRDGWVGPPAP